MLQRSPSAQFIAYLEKYSTAIFFSCCQAKRSHYLAIACLFTTRPLLFPGLLPLYPARVTLEWWPSTPSPSYCHLQEIQEWPRSKNPRGPDPKEKMNFPILQQASPLDQVLAKVCKSLNEVVCLTFCSLIPFYTEIPAVNIEWKILEI